ncbi:hypothetical protein [Variovorax saccharolyticus]|uniref:hypothetical protein n=1 Tax=Variovorax saccharolyticus TaxID=3053516 RepID=UPI0025752486|nr:hypothetical protein [Variovorax sp. J31P216]MDM0029917.1 hypothetical protein [Variovorax sp. J31P216]
MIETVEPSRRAVYLPPRLPQASDKLSAENETYLIASTDHLNPTGQALLTLHALLNSTKGQSISNRFLNKIAAKKDQLSQLAREEICLSWKTRILKQWCEPGTRLHLTADPEKEVMEVLQEKRSALETSIANLRAKELERITLQQQPLRDALEKRDRKLFAEVFELQQMVIEARTSGGADSEFRQVQDTKGRQIVWKTAKMKAIEAKERRLHKVRFDVETLPRPGCDERPMTVS